MKTSRILALASTLALGLSLSAQTATTPAAQSGAKNNAELRASDVATPSVSSPDVTNEVPATTAVGSSVDKAGQQIDYSKNPYVAPQDWIYIESNMSPGN